MATGTKKKTKKSTKETKNNASTKSSKKQTSQKKTTASSPDKRKKLVKNIAIWVAIFIVSLIAIDYGVQYLNYKASVAIVNGERIYKGAYYDQLDSTYGSTVIGQMIDETLIHQEAEKQEVSVSSDEIDAEIKELEESYGGSEQLEAEMELRGISMDELRKQIETTLIVEKILLDDIEITEEEKKEFYEEYKDVIFTEDEDPTYEEAKEQVEETLREQKVSQEVQVWLVELQDGATIKNNIDEPQSFSFLGITRAFFTSVTE